MNKKENMIKFLKLTAFIFTLLASGAYLVLLFGIGMFRFVSTVSIISITLILASIYIPKIKTRKEKKDESKQGLKPSGA